MGVKWRIYLQVLSLTSYVLVIILLRRNYYADSHYAQ